LILADSITIKEFRGIRQLTLDFKKKNFAVCGPNGTGKSGIVDALEFALTGNISRLSGEGTGAVSVREHAPHVDSSTQPENARVVLTVHIPSFGKTATINRTVKKANEPTITPNTPDVLGALDQMSQHPEFVLTRRELIRYVLSTPGDRAKEVQTLLRLDRVENFRQIFQRIANSCEKQIRPLTTSLNQAREQLRSALGIPELTDEALIETVNSRRVMLGIAPLRALTDTTSLKESLADAGPQKRPSPISKIQAKADIGSLRGVLGRLAAAETAETLTKISEQMRPLAGDPAVEDSVTREGFLQTALKLYDGEQCPVCDTAWSPSDLEPLIRWKLQHFENVTSERRRIEKNLEPVIGLLADLQSALELIERYGAKVEPNVSVDGMRAFRNSLKSKQEHLEALLPLSQSINTLDNLADTPEDVTKTIRLIVEGVDSVPEPPNRMPLATI
jgi:DNA repair exonuclease SbcCD ATPase subunit